MIAVSWRACRFVDDTCIWTSFPVGGPVSRFCAETIKPGIPDVTCRTLAKTSVLVSSRWEVGTSSTKKLLIWSRLESLCNPMSWLDEYNCRISLIPPSLTRSSTKAVIARFCSTEKFPCALTVITPNWFSILEKNTTPAPNFI